MFNLFDFTTGFEGNHKDKPRDATDGELLAYIDWLRERRGLPAMSKPDVRFAYAGTLRKGERGRCVGATFGTVRDRQYEAGSYSLLMPGYATHRQRVTMETLGEDGEAVASQTLPIEPKKCGVIWSRDDVRKAAGKVEKSAKAASIAAAKIKPADPRPVEAPQSAPAPSPTVCTQNLEIVSPRQPEPQPDASAALVARLEALERQVATLSRSVAPIGGKAPRSAAHERAVRRAWAERRARRLAMAIAEDHMRMREQMQAELQRASRTADAFASKRRRTVVSARSTLSRSRQATRFQSQRADVLHAQLVALRAAMADPSQPERASDINRLMMERDQARNASSALEQRCAGMQGALEQVANAVEEWSSRAIRAEAALRALPIAA